MLRVKLAAALAGTALFVCAAGCASSGNDLMAGATPETSCLTMYVYDGGEGVRQMVCDTAQTRAILDRLAAVPATLAKDWSLSKTTLPIFGFDMATGTGFGLTPAWTNGYWIDASGVAYDFKFDFAELAADPVWGYQDTMPSITSFPGARWLVQDSSGWHEDLLTPAPPPQPTPGISMALDDWTAGSATVTFFNDTDAIWYYGEHYTVQAQLSDRWYEIPAMSGGIVAIDIAYGVPAGGQASITYQLSPYGTLPPGTYRLVVSDLSVTKTLS